MTRHPGPWFALTIFCSAFLLFQVQPIIGRIVLPWFGGTPATWTTCLLFFQTTLLAGYLYAHLLGSLSGHTPQVILHLVLLLASAALLPFAPDAAWKPDAGTAPTLQVLLLLLVHVGGPFFMLSSTNPLLQRWFTTCTGGASPYRLYALSNVGSLLALVTYPFLVEPMLPVRGQVLAWSGLYLVYVAGAVGCAALFLRTGRAAPSGCAANSIPGPCRVPTAGDVVLWLFLAATASAMLMATTNQMCQEVASAPFLWILPLALYLLSFIICFDHDRWYDRRVWGAVLLLAAPLATHVLIRGVATDITLQLSVLALVLLACCMTCHGELVRARPAPRYLTLFYLVIATGGALGGAFVALAAPRWFSGYWEFHIALAAGCLFTFLSWYRRAPWRDLRVHPALLWGGLAGFMGLLVFTLVLQAADAHASVIDSRRNFFGVLSVRQGVTKDDDGTRHEVRSVYHGRIRHGFQFTEPARAGVPTAYYGPGTGVFYALTQHPRRAADPERSDQAGLRVGVVGLGAGTLAAVARPGDYFRFYEINPVAIELAHDPFTYLSDTPAMIDLVLGDGRLELEREAEAGRAQNFDVLILDAFISDAVPVHLLTLESVAVYRRHLRPGGLLAFNITNRFVDLVPVMLGIGEHYGLHVVFISNSGDNNIGVSRSRWAVLASDSTFADQPGVRPHLAKWRDGPPDPIFWTDDFSGLWQVMNW